ncbi:MAG: YdcF family protein [Nitrospirota bacterium]
MGLVEAQAPPFDPGTGKHFDVIVALGGGAETRGSLRPSDEPSISSIRRTLCATTLFTQGLAPKVLFAGGDASIIGEGAEEAVVMKDLAVRLGVPEQAILVETRSRNTYENAAQARLALGDASVLLVTSASHMPRALGLFRKQGLDTTSYPCGYYMQNRPEDAWDADLFDFLPSVEALYLNTLALIEVAGILVYSLTGKL